MGKATESYGGCYGFMGLAILNIVLGNDDAVVMGAFVIAAILGARTDIIRAINRRED